MYSEKWFEKSIRSVESGLATNLSAGLSREEAYARRRASGANLIYKTPKNPSLPHLHQLLTDFSLMLLLFTVLLATVMEHSFRFVPMIAVIVFYAVCSVLCILRTEQVMKETEQKSQPGARVLRDGKLYTVRQCDLVQGDVIYLARGDIVPCDARLVEEDELEVLETNLTGVGRTVPKSAEFIGYGDLPPAHQKNMVFASTVLTRGRGKAIVCETGRNTLVCRMGKNQTAGREGTSAVPASLRSLMRVAVPVLICTVFLTAMLAVACGQGKQDLFDVFLMSLSLTAASMCECIVPLGGLIAAYGVFLCAHPKKGEGSALIRSSGKIETLGDLTTLLIPSEGVLTDGTCSVALLYADHEEIAPDSPSFRSDGERVLRLALLSTGLHGAEIRTDHRSPEEAAVIREADRLGIFNRSLEQDYTILDHKSAEKLNPFHVTLFFDGEENRVALRGDPKEVLDRCSRFREDGSEFPMDPKMLGEFRTVCDSLFRRSLRVVAIASGKTGYQRLLRLNFIEKDLTFEGFLAFGEAILPGAAALVDKCRESGIKLYLTTSDDNASGVYLARSLGILRPGEEAITGRQLLTMKEGLIYSELPRHPLLQGVGLAHKRRLLRALHENGEKVGVLVHDLREIILLKEADIGFSQSEEVSDKLGTDPLSASAPRSCEALKYASDVIVSEPGEDGTGGIFSVFRAIECGRRVSGNLRKMAAYLLTVQSARFLLILYSVLTGSVLLTPFQILYSGLFSDFLATVILAFSPISFSGAKRWKEERSPLRLLFSLRIYLLIGAFFAAFSVLLPTLLSRIGILSSAEESCAVCFLSFLLTGLVTLFGIARDRMFSFRGIRFPRITLLVLLTELAVPTVGMLFPRLGRLMGLCPVPGVVFGCILTLNLLFLTVFFVMNRLMRERKNE